MKPVRSSVLWSATLFVLSLSLQAATPTAAISASPTAGRAPLATFFDASASTNTQTVLWEFGDGAASTAFIVSHIYTVAGTYTAKLTTSSSTGETASSTIVITVSGSGEGVVSDNINARWSIVAANFRQNHARPNLDAFNMNATFNTVDLPNVLTGLAASFSINNTYTVSGVMGEEGIFVSPDNARPSFFVQVDVKEQVLLVNLQKSDLSKALFASGAINETTRNKLVPLSFQLTVGAQSYQLTELFNYTSTAGGKGTGTFNLKKSQGKVADGFFAISRASAVENEQGDGHFFEFEGNISRPAGLILTQPLAGNFVFRFNDADPVTVPFDRIQLNGSRITYEQSDRDLGGVKSLVIEAGTRIFTLRTWDIKARPVDGGTGLPLRAQPFTAFNFSVRLDLDQPDGSTFRVVTATRMSRRSQDDAFWQTGRRKKRQ